MARYGVGKFFEGLVQGMQDYDRDQRLKREENRREVEHQLNQEQREFQMTRDRKLDTRGDKEYEYKTKRRGTTDLQQDQSHNLRMQQGKMGLRQSDTAIKLNQQKMQLLQQKLTKSKFRDAVKHLFFGDKYKAMDIWNKANPKDTVADIIEAPSKAGKVYKFVYKDGRTSLHTEQQLKMMADDKFTTITKDRFKLKDGYVLDSATGGTKKVQGYTGKHSGKIGPTQRLAEAIRKDLRDNYDIDISLQEAVRRAKASGSDHLKLRDSLTKTLLDNVDGMTAEKAWAQAGKMINKAKTQLKRTPQRKRPPPRSRAGNPTASKSSGNYPAPDLQTIINRNIKANNKNPSHAKLSHAQVVRESEQEHKKLMQQYKKDKASASKMRQKSYKDEHDIREDYRNGKISREQAQKAYRALPSNPDEN